MTKFLLLTAVFAVVVGLAPTLLLLHVENRNYPFVVPWVVIATVVLGVPVVAGLSAALLPQLGQLNIAAGLTLAALLLPGYVRLVTVTAAQRLEERAVLVERLVEIATRA